MNADISIGKVESMSLIHAGIVGCLPIQLIMFRQEVRASD